MTTNLSDILLPRAAWGVTASSSRLIAFIPIVIALVGVAAIMLGGISVRPDIAEARTIGAIDPMTTGSILSDDQRRAIEMLDL